MLIVEDDPLLGALLKMILEPVVQSVTLASDYASALKAVKENPEINLILLDLQLPDSPKERTLERIEDLKACASEPLVIAMTGYAEEGTMVAAKKAGADAFIEKYMAYDLCVRVKKELLRKGIRFQFSRDESYADFALAACA